MCKMVLHLPRAAGVITDRAHLLDHLGVLCGLLDIPLLVTDEKTFAHSQRYYPHTKVSLLSALDLSYEYLASHFDLLFTSDKQWTDSLYPLFQALFRKEMRFVYCPHGNSDKGHSLTPHSAHPFYDLHLVYGNHMSDHLKNTGASQQIRRQIETGNFRYSFYRNQKAFYDALAEEEIFSSLDPSKKNILYAPTWQDGENASSFFEACPLLIEQLPDSFNLLIKLHPLLAERNPGETHQILAQYENHRDVTFIDSFPPIYPLLARSDIYIGDFSSIGYDFLAFDKPLFFLKNANKESPLRKCGMEIPPSEKNSIYDFLLTHLADNQTYFSPIRQRTYHYVFGEEKDPAQIRDCLLYKT